MFKKILDNMKKETPIIHTITNYVTVNDCANIILANGASPIMSDEIDDIEDIISFSSALVINIGTLNKRTLEAMIFAGKIANNKGIPVILDPVGAGATNFRNKAVERLLDEVKFSVIKGNVSEIKFLTSKTNSKSGVDVSENDIVTNDNIENNIKLFKKLSIDTGAIIVTTGIIDIITYNDKIHIVKNGSSQMSKITGAGCMLGCVIACYLASNRDNSHEAVTFAVSVFGLAGEFAQKKSNGTGSYRVNLIDYMSKLNYEEIKAGMQVEIW